MSAQYRRSFLGKECRILLEEPVTLDGKDYYTGHTPEYVRMAVPAENLSSGGSSLKGTFVTGIGAEMLNDEVVLLQEKLRN